MQLILTPTTCHWLSVLGKNPDRPNRLIILLWLGVASLVVGLAGAGIGLIVTGMA